MQHAFLYGIIAALSLIGFVCISYFIMLMIYRPRGGCRYTVVMPHNAEAGTFERLLYGAYFRKMIFGDLIFDEIEIDFSELNDAEKEYAMQISDEIGCFIKTDREEKDERQS